MVLRLLASIVPDEYFTLTQYTCPFVTDAGVPKTMFNMPVDNGVNVADAPAVISVPFGLYPVTCSTVISYKGDVPAIDVIDKSTFVIVPVLLGINTFAICRVLALSVNAELLPATNGDIGQLYAAMLIMTLFVLIGP